MLVDLRESNFEDLEELKKLIETTITAGHYTNEEIRQALKGSFLIEKTKTQSSENQTEINILKERIEQFPVSKMSTTL
jgi:hypothetical protein